MESDAIKTYHEMVKLYQTPEKDEEAKELAKKLKKIGGLDKEQMKDVEHVLKSPVFAKKVHAKYNVKSDATYPPLMPLNPMPMDLIDFGTFGKYYFILEKDGRWMVSEKPFDPNIIKCIRDTRNLCGKFFAPNLAKSIITKIVN